MPRQVDLDMIELIDNRLTVDEYLKLRALVGWKKLYPGLQLSDLYSRSCHHAHDPGAESSGRRAAGCSGPETEIGGHYGGKDD